jgi:predicted DNA-binding protein
VTPAGDRPAPLEVRAVRVDVETWARLERMAAAAGASTSTLVREAIDAYLRHNRA